MRLLPGILAIALLGGCEASPAAASPTSPTIETAAPTAGYSYPDLPGDIEGRIAEADCEALDTVAAFMDREDVDPIVRTRAMEAILHRAAELGC